jgi:hypothetical protein
MPNNCINTISPSVHPFLFLLHLFHLVSLCFALFRSDLSFFARWSSFWPVSVCFGSTLFWLRIRTIFLASWNKPKHNQNRLVFRFSRNKKVFRRTPYSPVSFIAQIKTIIVCSRGSCWQHRVNIEEFQKNLPAFRGTMRLKPAMREISKKKKNHGYLTLNFISQLSLTDGVIHKISNSDNSIHI